MSEQFWVKLLLRMKNILNISVIPFYSESKETYWNIYPKVQVRNENTSNMEIWHNRDLATFSSVYAQKYMLDGSPLIYCNIPAYFATRLIWQSWLGRWRESAPAHLFNH